VNTITVGASLRESLFAHVGPVQMQLPSFITSSGWYRCEQCFMGMFDNWESPALPDVNPPSTLTGLKENTMKSLRRSIGYYLQVHFWNGPQRPMQFIICCMEWIGQIPCVGSNAIRGPHCISTFLNLQINCEDFPKKILCRFVMAFVSCTKKSIKMSIQDLWHHWHSNGTSNTCLIKRMDS
jgi:hypothetical protein